MKSMGQRVLSTAVFDNIVRELQEKILESHLKDRMKALKHNFNVSTGRSSRLFASGSVSGSV